MKYLTKEELVRLPTKRLLAYKRKHFSGCCSQEDFYFGRNAYPLAKDQEEKMKKDYAELCLVREVLAHRPHIEK